MPQPVKRSGHRWQQLCDAKRREWAKVSPVIVCTLCGREVDLDAPPRSDWSLSFDHITPVSVNPALQYDRNNVAPSHFACNRVRQNKPIDEIRSNQDIFRQLVEINIDRRGIRQTIDASNADSPFPRASSRHWLGARTDEYGVYHRALCTQPCVWCEEEGYAE